MPSVVLAGGAAAVFGINRWRRRGRVDWQQPGGAVEHSALAVRTVGGEGRPLVLVHGLAGSHLYWGAAYDSLAAEARLLVPDLLGFGASPRPDCAYGPDDHAHPLAAALRDLGVARPAAVAAHSTGALVALRLALRHPDLVASVVAFGPPIYRDGHHARRHLAGLGLLTRLLAMDSPLAQALCRWACCRHPEVAARLAQVLRSDLPAPVARDGVRHSWASYSGTLRNLVLASGGARWLGNIDVPVRLVAGSADRVVDVAYLASLAARHGNVSLDVWPGAGHDVPLVDPPRCVDEIRRSLDATPDSPPAGAVRPSIGRG